MNYPFKHHNASIYADKKKLNFIVIQLKKNYTIFLENVHNWHEDKKSLKNNGLVFILFMHIIYFFSPHFGLKCDLGLFHEIPLHISLK